MYCTDKMNVDLQFQTQQWLEKRNKNTCHRQLVVISGEQSWAITQAEKLLIQFAPPANLALWVGFRNTASTIEHCGTYRQHLGQERNALVYNCYSGLRANALIAYSGILRAEGLMVLLCPDFEKWPHFDDPQACNRTSYGFDKQQRDSLFTRWLILNIASDPTAFVIKQDGISGEPAYVAASDLSHPLYETTTEQQRAIKQIVRTASGHRHRPLVITADRGRGKSSALGMAASILIKDHQKTIIVTAPTLQNVEQVFSHSDQSIDEINTNLSQKTAAKGCVRYIPPDILIRDVHQADILFIDEAAAIPPALLKTLLTRFPRVVMCTTVHGYEGGGRGFELRFKPYLDKEKSGWKHLHLNTPIRWHQNDVLEHFWFKVMLMHDQPPLPIKSPELNELNYQIINKPQLLDNPNSLYALFSLLVNAHYQTTPDDLVRLLDAPELSLHTIEGHGSILAVAMVVEEGGSALASIADDIVSGQRRVLGHLAAQNLAFSSGEKLFCELRQRRIVRIAVHSQYRNAGIGSYLLASLVKSAQQQNIEMLSSSFGATAQLLYFWHNNAFSPVKLGFKRDAASDEFSTIVCKALNPISSAKLALIQCQFSEELLFQSTRQYQRSHSDLLCNLFKSVDFELSVTAQENNIVHQFLAGKRSYLSCERILTKYFILTISQRQLTKQVSAEEQLLMAVLIQHKDIAEICTLFSLTGKKALQKNILMAVENLR
ncbi:MAG: tRNA(Met) cytidine acetyltransferase [Paraglaciecola sp.]|jgi:tRNA(Met) cytidine acetyltransferase